MNYKVAEHIFRIDPEPGIGSWERLKWRYEPFATDESDALFTIKVVSGEPELADRKVIFDMPPLTEMETSIRVYGLPGDKRMVEIEQPRSQGPNGWLIADLQANQATLYLKARTDRAIDLSADFTLTTGIMLMYLLATTPHDTLMAHASCVAWEGKAYLFIAKSGTGKSTHTRLWLENIAGSELLNDDHPIVRVYPDVAIAYGSPWSGKTNCYRNLSFPIGAITRINRADHNRLRRLMPLQAYASLTSSFSGMSWEREQADGKHRSIENLIMQVPCYVLDCLPNAEAALVCNATLVADAHKKL